MEVHKLEVVRGGSHSAGKCEISRKNKNKLGAAPGVRAAKSSEFTERE